MNDFCVNFNDFSSSRLTTKGPMEVSMPDGLPTATEISIEYMYPIKEGEPDVKSRLIIECPQLKTLRGIVPPKAFGVGNSNGKPAIQVIFDLTDPAQKTFVGNFGNQFEYEEDEENRTVQIHKNPKPSTGVLGSIYDWSIEQYASFLASKKGKSRATPKNYDEAHSTISEDSFVFRRKHLEGAQKGQFVEGANPKKFFKLMSYKPGTPEENSAKFYLPNGVVVDSKKLYGKSFIFTPFLSFRRIFIGSKISVTMEILDCVVQDIFESPIGISSRSSRLVERLQREDPEQAKAVAEKYRLLQETDSISSTIHDRTAPTGCNVDDIRKEEYETVTLHESEVVETSSQPTNSDRKPTFSSRRPKLPTTINQTTE